MESKACRLRAFIGVMLACSELLTHQCLERQDKPAQVDAQELDDRLFG